MPELRSHARRNRAQNNPNPNPIAPIPQPDKLTARPSRQRRTAQNKRNKDPVAVADDKAGGSNNIVDRVDGVQATPLLGEERGEEVRVLSKEVAKKTMDEYDSGRGSGDKGPGAEDEGSTAPLPEKVI